MNALLNIFRFLYRIRWWLIIGPLFLTLLAIWKTRNMSRTYQTEMTVYTGVVSGYGIESEQLESQNWNILNNTLQNIINIITSKETLKNVSLHLYARCMIYGNPNKDNTYISAEHYKQLVDITPKEVLKLIDKSSEEKTVANLMKYEKPSRDNFVYGLFNWYHPHFSYNALRNIVVKRVESSDILEISYSANDPGIVFQTLDVLNDVYVKEYKTLQFGTTNNVIKYFEAELARVGAELRGREDSLTLYNIQNRIINYDEQTKQVSALDRDYELRFQDIQLAYSNSKTAVRHLEDGLNENLKSIKNNSEFLSRLNRISDLNFSIAEMESFKIDSAQVSLNKQPTQLAQLQRQLTKEEKDLKSFTSKYSDQKYTRDGYPTANFVTLWIDELLKFQKAEAQLLVMDNFKKQLDQQYSHFSPIGSTIKRQERSINFTEQSYLSILGSLNTARLRLKSLEMNSATLKVINPPTFPLESLPTKRRSIVAGAFIGSLVFILGIFLIIELLDRTLRDRIRTERVTSGRVLGAFPRVGGLRRRLYHKACREKAAHYVANQVYGYFNTSQSPHVVNLLTLSINNKNLEISEELAGYWRSLGVGVRVLDYQKDFNPSSREFLFAKGVQDFYQEMSEDIILVNHAPLKSSPVPSTLLRQAAVNLLLVRADSVWKDSDQILFKELNKQSGESPVLICLSEAEQVVVENFTGMLPPYTPLRKLAYRYYQLGLTSARDE